jgi:hypothetical protein
MSKQRFSLALAVVGALGLGLFLFQRANDAKVQALQREIRGLAQASAEAVATAERAERVVPTLVSQIIAAPQTAKPATGVQEALPTSREAEGAPAVTKAGPTVAEVAAHVESSYARQAVDASWAGPTQVVLSEHMGKQLASSALESLECRESLCKARLRHPDPASYSAFIDRLYANANDIWKGPITFYRDSSGEGDNVAASGEATVRNSIYFAKEGTDLPRL